MDIEDGAPLGYMNPASLDGVRPTITINLKSMCCGPSTRSTLTAHGASQPRRGGASWLNTATRFLISSW